MIDDHDVSAAVAKELSEQPKLKSRAAELAGQASLAQMTLGDSNRHKRVTRRVEPVSCQPQRGCHGVVAGLRQRQGCACRQFR